MSECTAKILSYFEQLNAIPRCSHNEEQVCRWLQKWADERQLAHQRDADGNLVVQLPASVGFESEPLVVLQGHMDMVCEKTPESTHDFAKNPIVSHAEGDWLTADGTTLGADNGIAIAYMLALADDPAVQHPSLELLFTVDEETGLNGAKALKPEFVQGRKLINLDSEDEGVFTIGCAGGIDTTLGLELDTTPVNAKMQRFGVRVGGLMGGHSGIDIHKQRGNANKFLARTLSRIEAVSPLRLISVQGGSRKNAIPRDAEAIFCITGDVISKVEDTVAEIEVVLKREYARSDEALFIKVAPAEMDTPVNECISSEDSAKVIQMLLAIPDGVAGMSSEMADLVETSNNLATVSLEKGKLTILTSQRSAAMSRLEEITAKVHAVARLSGAGAEDHDIYPAWQPDMASALLHQAQRTYRLLFNQEPTIQVIHAGLECAIIGDIYPGMDMISLGPTIRNPHSPDERLFIPSVQKVWDFLVALLGSKG